MGRTKREAVSSAAMDSVNYPSPPAQTSGQTPRGARQLSRLAALNWSSARTALQRQDPELNDQAADQWLIDQYLVDTDASAHFVEVNGRWMTRRGLPHRVHGVLRTSSRTQAHEEAQSWLRRRNSDESRSQLMPTPAGHWLLIEQAIPPRLPGTARQHLMPREDVFWLTCSEDKLPTIHDR